MSGQDQLNEFVEPNDPVIVMIPVQPNTDPLVLPTSIKFVLKNTVLLNIPKEAVDALSPYLQPGKSFDLEFHKKANDRPVKMPVNITALNVDAGTGAGGCLVEVPENFKDYFMMYRAHVRVPIKMDVQIICHPHPEKKMRDPFQALCVNLSGGGMRLIVPEKNQLDLNDKVTLRFTPPESDDSMRIQSEVVLSRHNNSLANPHIVTAVKFMNLTRAQEDQIVGICFRYQLSQQHLR